MKTRHLVLISMWRPSSFACPCKQITKSLRNQNIVKVQTFVENINNKKQLKTIRALSYPTFI